eukprot:TRINITY_DN10769_c0_g2_i1.p1 TRINITY_DN10769_c0_g2~~TRINITY_DN10769_c0_g2_i1.p1  ORF type:complete len:161 (-),score=16.87 TRINITY_DN10769_c0_g2_i1:41-454(-)
MELAKQESSETVDKLKEEHRLLSEKLAGEEDRLRKAVLQFFYYPKERPYMPVKKMDLEKLTAEKSALKRDIFDLNAKWAAFNGKKPSANDKLPLKALYFRYNQLKSYRARLVRASKRDLKRKSTRHKADAVNFEISE